MKTFNGVGVNAYNAIKDKFNGIVGVNQESIDFLSAFKDKYTSNNNTFNKNLDQLASQFQNVDERALSAARSVMSGQESIESLNRIVPKASTGLSVLSKDIKELGKSMFAIGSSMAIMAVASVAINFVYDLATATSRLRAEAKKLGDEFNSTKSKLDSYKSQIEELNNSLENDNLSYEESKNARERLMKIQDELIEKYKGEAENIELVRKAISGETDAIDKLASVEWGKIVGQFNQNKGMKGATNWIRNLFSGADNNFERAIQEYETSVKHFDLSGTDGESMQKLTNAISTMDGVSINTDTLSLEVAGQNLEDIYKKLVDVQTVAHNLGLDEVFQKLSKNSADLKDIVDQYSAIYDQHIINDVIFDKNDGFDFEQKYKDINDAYKGYRDAVTASGLDSDDAKKAAEKYTEVLTEAIDYATKNSSPEVAYLYENMFPELQKELDNHAFELRFEANEKNLKNGLEYYFSKFNSVEDYQLFNPNGITDSSPAEEREKKNAYLKIQELGTGAGDILATAIANGFIESQLVQDLQEVLGNDFKKLTENDKELIRKNLSTDDIKVLGSWDKLNRKLIELRRNALNLKDATPEDIIAGINKTSEGWEELAKIQNSLTGKAKDFNYAILDDKNFKENFSNLDGYAEFVTKLKDGKADIEAVREPLTKLSTEFLKHSSVLKMVNDGNKTVAASYLEQIGIVNATDVVETALINNKIELAKATGDNTVETYNEIKALAEEEGATNTAKAAFLSYKIQKEYAKDGFSTFNDIQQLQNIVKILGGAGKAWQTYYAMRANMDKVFSMSEADFMNYIEENHMSIGLKDRAAYQIAMQKEAAEKYNDAFKEIDELVNVNPVDYKAPQTTNGDGGSGSGSEDTIDWIERKTKILQQEETRLRSLAEDSYSPILTILQLSTEEAEKFKKILDDDDVIHPDWDYDAYYRMQEVLHETGLSFADFYDLLMNGNHEGRMNAYDQLINYEKQELEEAKKNVDYYAKSYQDYIDKHSFTDEELELITTGGDFATQYKGDKLKQLKEANELRDKYNEQLDKEEEIEKRIRNDVKSRYDIEMEYLKMRTSEIQHQFDLVEKEKSYLEASGEVVGASYIEKLIGLNDENRQEYENQYELALQRLQNIQEQYGDGSTEFESQMSVVRELENSINDCAVKQAEYNKELRELPIKNAEKIAKLYSDITSKIQNWGAEQEKLGKKLNSSYYTAIMSSGRNELDALKSQRNEILDVMSEYTKGSDNWIELNSELSSVDSSISSIIQNMAEWNDQMLNVPINKIEELKDSLNIIADALSQMADDYSTILSAVIGTFDNRKYEIDQEIKALNNRKDALHKENEELQQKINLEKAEYDLEKLREQKNNRVIRNGQVVYEVDADALKNAQENLVNAQEQYQEYLIDKEIEGLQKQQEVLDDIAEKWSRIEPDKQLAQNQEVADAYFNDPDWISKVLSGDDSDLYNLFKKDYETNQDNVKETQDQITKTENTNNLLNSYINAYKAGQITQEQLIQGVNLAISSMDKNAQSNLSNVLNYMESAYGSNGTVTGSLDAIQGDIGSAYEQVKDNLGTYVKNVAEIMSMSGSWGALTSDVSSMSKDVHRAANNLEDDFDDLIDDIEDGTNRIIKAIVSSSSTLKSGERVNSSDYLGAKDVSFSTNGSAAEEFAEKYGYDIEDVEEAIEKITSGSISDDDILDMDLINDVKENINSLVTAIKTNTEVINKNTSATNKNDQSSKAPNKNEHYIAGTNIISGSIVVEAGKGDVIVTDGKGGKADSNYVRPSGYAVGIEGGPIQRAKFDKEQAELYQLTTKDIQEGATPAILHPNEVVLNKEQQSQLLENIRNFVPYDPFSEYGIDASKLIGSVIPNKFYGNSLPKIAFPQSSSIGSVTNDYKITLNLPEVKDPDGFARFMEKDFPNIIRQQTTHK